MILPSTQAVIHYLINSFIPNRHAVLEEELRLLGTMVELSMFTCDLELAKDSLREHMSTGAAAMQPQKTVTECLQILQASPALNLDKIKEQFSRLGFQGFKSPEQEMIISNLLAFPTLNLFARLPTSTSPQASFHDEKLFRLIVPIVAGGGKSLCFQLPSLLEPNKGLTVVVMPLIALMSDQVKKAKDMGIRVASLSSDADSMPIDDIVKGVHCSLRQPHKTHVQYV